MAQSWIINTAFPNSKAMARSLVESICKKTVDCARLFARVVSLVIADSWQVSECRAIFRDWAAARKLLKDFKSRSLDRIAKWLAIMPCSYIVVASVLVLPLSKGRHMEPTRSPIILMA